MASIIWTPQQTTSLGDGQFHPTLREPRKGVMVHYDGSGPGPNGDRNGLAWFGDPKCEVSYQVGVLDDGRWAQIAPDTARAWHAGVCLPSDPKRLPYVDANSAFYGIAALTDERHQVTLPQLLTLAWKVRVWFARERWSPEETWRIVGHDQEAVYPPGHAQARKRGRKIDPTGPNRDNPILSLDDLRWMVPRISL